MDYHPVHTIPNNHPPKNFVQIILAAKLLVPQFLRPPNNSIDLCLLFCLLPSSMDYSIFEPVTLCPLLGVLTVELYTLHN